MINLYGWATRWNIPSTAIDDLRYQMGIYEGGQSVTGGVSESAVASHTRLSISKQGGLLWRNNVGAMQGDDGRVVRYGLANESKKMNQYIKSSDYVGVIPVKITGNLVGQTIGRFIAIETKKQGWLYTGTEREIAQNRFLQLVTSKGGVAFFKSTIDDIVI